MSGTGHLLAPDLKELIVERRFVDLRAALRELDPADVADILTEMEPEDAALAFRVLKRDVAAEAFTYLEGDLQERLIEELGAERSMRLLEDMDPDDRVAFLDELPAEVATRLINALSPENRRVTQAMLGYPPESVGRMMTPDYVRVDAAWTAAHAIEHVRKHGRDAETIHWIYAIGPDGRLVGDLHIRRLLLADLETPIDTLCEKRPPALRASDDREEAVRVMGRYDRTALPVVDAEDKLLGIVTFDDVADVAEEEATEDIQQLGGVAALDQPYMETGAAEMFRKRGGWLAALFIGQTFTVAVLSIFENQIHALTALAVFIPLVISCGGNSGSQAATLVTRALALDEVTPGDWARIVRRELFSGVLLGATLGALGLVTVLIWNTYRRSVGAGDDAAPMHLIAMTIALAVTGVVTWGTIVGSLLPLILKRAGFDPGVASTPLVATLMDTSGMLIYFAVAIVLLHEALG